MACTYTLTDANGKKITLVGKPAFKRYLAEGGLAHLMPVRFADLSAIVKTDSVARKMMEGWKNPPRLIVAKDMNDKSIAPEVRAEDQRQRSNGAKGEPEGFFYNGTTYLINSQINGDKDIARILFHESLGHFGLRGVFGDALNTVLQQIVDLRKKDVISKAKSYGYDTTDNEDMLRAAEEVLAEMAQTTPEIGFVKRAIAIIRNWLRENVEFFSEMNLSDAEVINYFIAPARAYVEGGAQSNANGDVAFAKAYHGTPHTIEGGFDLSKVGTGEGALEYGYGMYFAESKNVANQYAYTLTDVNGGAVKMNYNSMIPVPINGSVADAIHNTQKLIDKLEKKATTGDEYAIKALPNLREKLEKYKKQSNIYTMDIPDEHIPDMLDWDKSFSEQTDAVKEAIGKAPKKFLPYIKNRMSGDSKGSDLYWGFVNYFSFEKGLDQNTTSKKAASEALHKLGIKGIRYLDGDSRNAGDGSRNIVVFDPSDVKILEKNGQAQFSRSQTDTEAFQKWFGDGKVVDAEGKPLVVYHGTSVNRTEFKRNRNNDLAGAFFTSDKNVARDYAEMDSDDGGKAKIVKAYLSIKNPFISKDYNEFQIISQKRRDDLESQGYDGVIGEYKDGTKEYIAFEPTQIKSAIGNNGEFDPKNPDIRFSRSKQSNLDQLDTLGDPSPAEAKEVESALKGKSVLDVAQWLTENYPDADKRLVAEKALEALNWYKNAGVAMDFRIVNIGESVNSSVSDGARGTTTYKHDKNSGKTTLAVSLNGADVEGRVGTSYQVALHEIVHAASTIALDMASRKLPVSRDLRQAYSDLKEVFNFTKMELNNRIEKGDDRTARRFKTLSNMLSDEQEFMTWAMTNSEAQAMLESIPYQTGTLWSQFVKSIRKLLGLNQNSDTVLSEVLRIGETSFVEHIIPNVDMGGTRRVEALWQRTQNAKSSERFDSSDSVAEAKRVEGEIKGKTAIEAAKWLASDIKDPAQKQIAERVYEAMGRMEKHGATFSLNIAGLNDQAPRPLTEFAKGHTVYSLKNDGKLDVAIWLNGSDVDGRLGTTKEVLLHELIHAITAASIDVGAQPAMRGTNVAQVSKSLKEALNHLRIHLKTKKDLTQFEKNALALLNNSTENEHEILAWAMTDRQMQATLEGIPYGGGTIWSEFVKAIRTLLGLPVSAETMLSDVMHQFDTLTDGNFSDVYGEFANRMTNNRTAFSRSLNAEDKAEGITPPDQGLLRRIQGAVQDKFNRVSEVQARIEKLAGKPLSARSNYYGAETNRPGRIAARLEDSTKDLFEPLMQNLAKVGHKPEELAELLHAMHAKERNEKVASINPDMPDGGSGMTNAQADEALAKYKGNHALHKLAKDARKIAKEVLDLKLAYELISKDDYDTLNNAYKNYVPLKGDGEYGVKVKRAMGHEEREEHILENIARDYNQAVVTGEKNLARQSLAQMVIENPDPEYWTVGVPPKGRYVAGKVYSITKNRKEVATFTSGSQVSAFLEAKGAQAVNYEVKDSAGERVQEFTKPLQDNEVIVYFAGQPVRLQIKDETLARQLRPLDQGQMNAILQAMRDTNRYLSKVYTGYNPSFIIRNAARDAMTGTINMIGNEGVVTAAKAWANYPSALKALTIYATAGKEPDSKVGKYLKEYRMNGGKTGASWMSDLEQHGKTLERMFDDAYGASGYLKDGMYGKAAVIAGRKIVGGMAHVVEIANQATENGLRLALYIAMREQGTSAGEAARAAKTVTVDFDKKGSMTGALGAIYLFFNPAVQGTANMFRTLTHGKHKGQAWMALGTLAALGTYIALQGMDDDKDRWLGESWETRSKNLIINIGGKSIRVPVSMEYAPFYALGMALAEASRGESKIASAGRVVSSFIDAYIPMQGAFNYDSDNHGMDAALSVVPTVIKPYVEIAANRNTFGSQIVPENDFSKDKPDNQKMYKGTKGSAYDAVAQGIASAGQTLGAGTYENDITKISPETLKMMWRTYTGGLGQFVADIGGLGNIAAQDGKNIEVSDIPVAKDFVKPNDSRAIKGRYYDLTKEARSVSTQFKEAKKAGDDAAIDAILDRPDKSELLGLDRMIKKTNEAGAALQDEKVEINSDKTLSLSEKREKLKSLDKEEEALYRDAIGAFK